MTRTRSVYICQSCGSNAPKWLGKCPDCGGWNTFLEERVGQEKKGASSVALAAPRPQSITEITLADAPRLLTGMPELDRVLGGGMVPGSAVLIGGDPGIGKSTLLLQAMGRFASAGHSVLYVTGEESLRQIRMRAERIGVLPSRLDVYAETSLELIIEAFAGRKPDVVVMDSIQTVDSDELDSSPGSVSQVRECSHRLISCAKSMDSTLFLVGHVTKEGALAGPKVLEHMVDTVLYFEGERGHPFRILRTVKNRYGSVMEIGVFEMREAGLVEVSNPSEMFLAERPAGASGSAVTSSLEGTRTVLVEIQSLVCPTIFGMPRRTVVGVDHNKVMLLAAVLEKKAGIRLTNHDIFIKVAGGIRLDEPAIDLGIVASLASNFLDKPVDQKTVVFGEVGLAGEIRAINQAEPRCKEAAKLGFTRCILPRDNMKKMKAPKGMALEGVFTVAEAMEKLF